MKGQSKKHGLETGLDLPVRNTDAGDLRRVRLLRSRDPLLPLPKENHMALTASDIALLTIAVTVVLIWLFGIDVI